MKIETILSNKQQVIDFYDWVNDQKHPGMNTSEHSILDRYLAVEYLFAIVTFITIKKKECTIFDLVYMAKEDIMRVFSIMEELSPCVYILDKAELFFPYKRGNKNWLSMAIGGCQLVMISLYYNIWGLKDDMEEQQITDKKMNNLTNKIYYV